MAPVPRTYCPNDTENQADSQTAVHTKCPGQKGTGAKLTTSVRENRGNSRTHYSGRMLSQHTQFAVGFKFQGKTGYVVVDAEDALIAALKVKMQHPEALIAYVRQQNKRGDARHLMRRLSSESF